MKMRRRVLRELLDFLHTKRRQVRRLIVSPGTALVTFRYRTLIRHHDWSTLRAMLPQFAARAAKDFRLLIELGYAGLRLEEFELGVALLQQAAERAGTANVPRWRGEPVRDATLVIHLAEKADQGVASGIELSGYVRAAAKRAAKAVVVAAPRMVPLFQRTLPEVVVIPIGGDVAAHVQGRAIDVSINELKLAVGYAPATITANFVPLATDPAQTQAMRQRYLAGRSLPLIGISWWSSHHGKDLPNLTHWARLTREIPAQYVSLQYGDVAADIAALSGGDPKRLIVDPAVDQMANMDQFASQIAALDLVILISGSAAHLAGALGKPTILVRDDLFRRNWPYLSDRVPWYPATRVIGKNDRDWNIAFDEVIAGARSMLEGKA